MNHRLPFAALACVFALAACSDDNLPTEATGALGPAFSSGAAADDIPRMHVDAQGTPYVPGQLIVRFTPGAAGADIAQQNRGSLRRASRLARVFIVAVPEGEEAVIRNNLRMNPNVEFAELDYAVNVIPCGTGDCTEPGLYFSGRKWDHHNTGTIIDNSTSNTVVAVTGKAGADMDWLEAFEYLGPASPDRR
jgi:hypothetical protein